MIPRTVTPEATEPNFTDPSSDVDSLIRRGRKSRVSQAREENLLERVLRRCALGGHALRRGPANTPVASINYGAGGIAYALYRIARRRDDPELLALADVWTQKAFALSSRKKAFYEPDLGITPDTVGNVSLFHSVSGLHCVRALVSIAMGDVSGANRTIHAFAERSRGPCDNPDLTLGKTSLLMGCAELIEAMPAPRFIDVNPVQKRGDEIAGELARLLKSGKIATSASIPALGIAHGWAGFAFALLRWARATEKKAHPIVEGALDELAALAEPHGSGLRWPVHNTTKPPFFWEGWCNGTAGHTMLFALAHNVLRVGRFGEIAERAAISAWAAETPLGTLCCGLGGIGYALLATYRLTGSALWLKRAHTIARRAAADSSKYFLRDSLYKGAVGVAVLVEDLKKPELAAMPLFEPTR
jgi:eukaryotic-like serine/threonine-protein kinase